MKNLVYLSLNTQFENLGDCVINSLLITELAQSSRVRVLVRHTPPWLIEQLGVIPGVELFRSPRQWWTSFVSQAVKCSGKTAFHFKPGHHASHSGVQGSVKSSLRLSFVSICRLFRVHTRFLGASINYTGRFARFAESLTGRLYEVYGVRDANSLADAGRMKIPAIYTPDLAFLLQRDPNDSSVSRKNVAISFRERVWNRRDGVHGYARLVDAVKSTLRECNLDPLVVSQVQYDDEISSSLAADLETNVVSFAQSYVSCRKIFDSYSGAELVISNRLHSLLFGWSRGAIPIPVLNDVDDTKIHSLFATLGLEDLVLNVANVESLNAHVAGVLANKASWNNKLAEVFEQQRLELKKNFS